MLFRSHTRNRAPIPLPVAAILLLIMPPVGRTIAQAREAAATAPLTQNRINEFAAACLTAEMSFSGIKGTPKPGETPAQFAARVDSYVSALDRLAKAVEPLRTAPALHDSAPDNVARWKKIARAATGLPSVARDARATWNAHVRGAPVAAVGPKLMAGLLSVQTLLNELRDARP